MAHESDLSIDAPVNWSMPWRARLKSMAEARLSDSIRPAGFAIQPRGAVAIAPAVVPWMGRLRSSFKELTAN